MGPKPVIKVVKNGIHRCVITQNYQPFKNYSLPTRLFLACENMRMVL